MLIISHLHVLSYILAVCEGQHKQDEQVEETQRGKDKEGPD